MIYNFKTSKKVKLNTVGGKAKALIETTKVGFPVPEGIALSVHFFDEWLAEIKSSNEWKKLMKNITKANCDAVKKKAINMSFTDNQRKAFDKELNNLTGEIFAVRSSSPEEDLKGTSFAGMYETFLGVTKQNLEKHVAKVFASCFDFRVMKYKKQNKIDIDSTRIAIVIQKQIASSVSGVGFSLNPLNNCYDEIVINASFGLGEAVVSGIVTPDTYVVESVTNKIIEKKINEKQIALCLKPNGGIEEKTNNNKGEQALSDKQILELSALIKRCEEYYALPVDTEWAYEGAKLYLLQLRPITTYLPLFPELVTKPGQKRNIYIDVNVLTQGFSEPMSVLGLDLWSKMIENMKGGMMSRHIEGTSPALHGRQYINLSAVNKVMGKSAVRKVFNSYDGNIKKIFEDIDINEYTPDKAHESLKGTKGKAVKMIVPMIPTAVKASFANDNDVVKDYLKCTNDVINNAKNLDQKASFEDSVECIIEELNTAMNKMGFLMAGFVSHSTIKKIFKGHNVEEEIVALAMDLEGNPTSEMGHMMFNMACYDEFKNTHTREQFIKNIEEKSYSKEFMVLYNEFMEKYGVRGFMEIDVATKRAYEDIGSIYDRVKEVNTEDNQITKVKEKRAKAYETLLLKAKELGKEKKFVKAARKYQAVFGYREHPKYVIVCIYAMIHNLCIEMGEEWVKEGRLENKYQIFDLGIDEITKAQIDKKLNLIELREKNLAPYKKVEHVKDWPVVIDSRGKIYKPKMEIKDGDIVGDAIAPGKVIGKAKVLNSPYEKTLNPGEILVTKFTEPSWTPIFINAAGVVMEVGGPLQHGGIIAREYGIPCVSGLMGIMDIVKDGDTVEVDGTNGIVKIVEST